MHLQGFTQLVIQLYCHISWKSSFNFYKILFCPALSILFKWASTFCELCIATCIVSHCPLWKSCSFPSVPDCPTTYLQILSYIYCVTITYILSYNPPTKYSHISAIYVTFHNSDSLTHELRLKLWSLLHAFVGRSSSYLWFINPVPPRMFQPGS